MHAMSNDSVKVRSKEGFVGCFSSMELNGVSVSLHGRDVQVPAQFNQQIVPGCSSGIVLLVDSPL